MLKKMLILGNQKISFQHVILNFEWETKHIAREAQINLFKEMKEKN